MTGFSKTLQYMHFKYGAAGGSACASARAADSVLILRLDAEWQVLAQSRQLRERLISWARTDRRLGFDDGDRLVANDAVEKL